MAPKKKGAPLKENPNKEYVAPTNKTLKDLAIGISQLESGKFALVKIKYNPITCEVGIPELTVVHGSSSDAEYDFRDAIDALIQTEFIEKLNK